MSYTILIRESVPADTPRINELVKTSYLSNVNTAWCNALFKEITFQFIVMTAAVMFIFLGMPLLFCVAAVPFVMFFIYIVVYLSFFTKATEIITSKRAIKTWVAEAYLPYFCAKDLRTSSFRIVREVLLDDCDQTGCRKIVVGSVSVMNNLQIPHSAWLFKLVVDRDFRRKGVARNLVRAVQSFCKKAGYLDVQLAVSECQEDARRIFADCGFQLRLMYHKQLIGTALTLLMYHLECALEPDL